jgi:hypothetical protein
MLSGTLTIMGESDRIYRDFTAGLEGFMKDFSKRNTIVFFYLF